MIFALFLLFFLERIIIRFTCSIDLEKDVLTCPICVPWVHLLWVFQYPRIDVLSLFVVSLLVSSLVCFFIIIIFFFYYYYCVCVCLFFLFCFILQLFEFFSANRKDAIVKFSLVFLFFFIGASRYRFAFDYDRLDSGRR